MSHYLPPEESGDALMTVDEVATLLRVDVTTVRRWIKGGAMRALLLPMTGKRHMYRLKRSDIDALLNVEAK